MNKYPTHPGLFYAACASAVVATVFAVLPAFTGFSAVLSVFLIFPLSVFSSIGFFFDTVSRSEKRVTDSIQDESLPENVTRALLLRVPILTPLCAWLLGIAAACVTGQVMIGFLVLIAWGWLSFPLALSALREEGFADAVKNGLIYFFLTTAFAFVLHVFVSNGFSFDFAAFVAWIRSEVSARFTEVYRLFSEWKDQIPSLGELLKDTSCETFVAFYSRALLISVPELILSWALELFVLVWWVGKALLSRTTFEVKTMESFRDFVAPYVLTLAYTLLMIFSLFFATDSTLGIALELLINAIGLIIAYGGIVFVYRFFSQRISRSGLAVFVTVAVCVGIASLLQTSGLILLGFLASALSFSSRIGGDKS